MGGNPSGRRHSDRLKRVRRDAKRIAAKHAAATAETQAKPKPAEKK